MKKCLLALLAAVLLAGCGAQPLETVSDIYPQVVTAPPRRISLELPKEAAMPVFSGEDGEKLYLCGDFELRIQTLPAGNLTGALRSVTGLSAESLRPIQTRWGENTRYDCVWCTAGEEGEQVGKTAVIDDGSYYYCVTAMAPAELAQQQQEIWQRIFSTIAIS